MAMVYCRDCWQAASLEVDLPTKKVYVCLLHSIDYDYPQRRMPELEIRHKVHQLPPIGRAKRTQDPPAEVSLPPQHSQGPGLEVR